MKFIVFISGVVLLSACKPRNFNAGSQTKDHSLDNAFDMQGGKTLQEAVKKVQSGAGLVCDWKETSQLSNPGNDVWTQVALCAKNNSELKKLIANIKKDDFVLSGASAFLTVTYSLGSSVKLLDIEIQ